MNVSIVSLPLFGCLLCFYCFFSVTIFVLIVESHWTNTNNSSSQKKFIIENNSTCWQREEYTVIRDCHPCTG